MSQTVALANHACNGAIICMNNCRINDISMKNEVRHFSRFTDFSVQKNRENKMLINFVFSSLFYSEEKSYNDEILYSTLYPSLQSDYLHALQCSSYEKKKKKKKKKMCKNQSCKLEQIKICFN